MIQTKRPMFHAAGDDINNAETQSSTLNQEYNKQVDAGSFKGSFADFMKHLSVNKVIDTGYDLTDSVRKLFAKTAGQTVTEPTVVEEPASSMNNMTKWFIGIGVATLLIWGGVKIYKHYKGGK